MAVQTPRLVVESGVAAHLDQNAIMRGWKARPF
jgi:hypothetical protein